MEEMANLINNVARFLAFGIGGVSVIVFIYAGFLFMTASGDPQKTGQARQALMGAFIGLIITGAAFVLPRIISQAIIEPAGGVSIVTEGQVACDSLLEDQLVAQRGANNGARMNEVIRLIQNRQECSADIWNPRVIAGAVDAVANLAAVVAADDHSCVNVNSETSGKLTNPAHAVVGSVEVPLGLRVGSAADRMVVERSFRDPSNNIIVYFTTFVTTSDKTSLLPSDQSICWLYTSRLRSWSRNYGS